MYAEIAFNLRLVTKAEAAQLFLALNKACSKSKYDSQVQGLLLCDMHFPTLLNSEEVLYYTSVERNNDGTLAFASVGQGLSSLIGIDSRTCFLVWRN